MKNFRLSPVSIDCFGYESAPHLAETYILQFIFELENRALTIDRAMSKEELADELIKFAAQLKGK